MSKLRSRRVMHLRMTGGSTYGDELIDETGNVVGAISSFVSTSPKTHNKTVYTLHDPEETFATAKALLEAWEKRCVQAQRDAEWNAAVPKEPNDVRKA